MYFQLIMIGLELNISLNTLLKKKVNFIWKKDNLKTTLRIFRKNFYVGSKFESS